MILILFTFQIFSQFRSRGEGHKISIFFPKLKNVRIILLGEKIWTFSTFWGGKFWGCSPTYSLVFFKQSFFRMNGFLKGQVLLVMASSWHLVLIVKVVLCYCVCLTPCYPTTAAHISCNHKATAGTTQCSIMVSKLSRLPSLAQVLFGTNTNTTHHLYHHTF